MPSVSIKFLNEQRDEIRNLEAAVTAAESMTASLRAQLEQQGRQRDEALKERDLAREHNDMLESMMTTMLRSIDNLAVAVIQKS